MPPLFLVENHEKPRVYPEGSWGPKHTCKKYLKKETTKPSHSVETFDIASEENIIQSLQAYINRLKERIQLLEKHKCLK